MKKSELRQIIREMIITELDFKSQDAFNSYNKQHKLRKSTKVNIAGKQTTAGQAAMKKQPDNKGTKLGDNLPVAYQQHVPEDVETDSSYDMAQHVSDNVYKFIDKKTLPKNWEENGLDKTNSKRIEKYLKDNYTGDDFDSFVEDFWDDFSTMDMQAMPSSGSKTSGGQAMPSGGSKISSISGK